MNGDTETAEERAAAIEGVAQAARHAALARGEAIGRAIAIGRVAAAEEIARRAKTKIHEYVAEKMEIEREAFDAREADKAEAAEEARLVFEHETAREHVANALQMLTMAERTCSPGVNIAAVTIADHDAIVARLRKAIAKIDAQAKARAEIRAAVESIREKVKAAQSSDDLSFVISLREMVAIFESLDDISKAAR